MFRATVIALVVIVMTAMGSSAFADGVSPWLPAPGAGFVNLSYVSQNANQFYVQDNLRGTPPQNASTRRQRPESRSAHRVAERHVRLV